MKPWNEQFPQATWNTIDVFFGLAITWLYVIVFIIIAITHYNGMIAYTVFVFTTYPAYLVEHINLYPH